MLPDLSLSLTPILSGGNDSVSCAEAKSLKCTWGGSNTLGSCMCVRLADATLFFGEDVADDSSLAVCEPKVRAGVKVCGGERSSNEVKERLSLSIHRYPKWCQRTSSTSVSGGISSNSSTSSGKGLLNIQFATVELWIPSSRAVSKTDARTTLESGLNPDLNFVGRLRTWGIGCDMLM